MSISLVAAFVGAVAAAVGTFLLARRCARMPRMDMIAWAIAMTGLTLALAIQALGYQRGFGATTFRAVQFCTQLIVPLALAWGICELTGRSLPARFAARLSLSALAVVAAVILATDPLSGQPFSQAWPAASVHYQFIPNGLLKLIAVVTVVTALVAVAVTAVRGQTDPSWRPACAAIGIAGVADVAVVALQVRLPVNSGYAVACVLAAVLIWLAGTSAARFRADGLRPASGLDDDTGWHRSSAVPVGRGGYGADDSLGLYRDSGPPRYGDTGGFRGYPDTGGFGPDTGGFGPDTGSFDPYRDTGGFGPDTGSFGPDTGGFGGPVTGSFDALYRENGEAGQGENGGRGRYADDPAHPDGAAAAAMAPGSDVWRPAAYRAAADTGPGPDLPPAADLGSVSEQDTERLYGQIAIYTLLEDGVTEFDRMTGQVVEQVRAHEPDTLVYVVHVVPSAPLQRILYEVYRDQAAYDEHLRQPYVQEFEAGRKPHVLATNVIGLGVQQAKVSPLGAPAARPPQPPRPPERPLGPPPSRQPERPSGPPPSARPSGPPPSARPSGYPQPPPSRPSGYPPPPPRPSAHPLGPPPSSRPPSSARPQPQPHPGPPAAPRGRPRGDRAL